MTVVICLVALAALAALGLWYVLRVYFEYKGTRIITCPETKRPAAVEVDAKRAALTSCRGRVSLRLRDCSRWPERAGCDQACLSQIEEAPADCLLRSILAKWYAGKACVICRKPIPEFDWLDVDWLEHRPGLLSREGEPRAWSDFRPEELAEALEKHWPICWDCHLAESFRRRHPELVTDRPEH
jgi:hypothetical protein